MGKLKLQMQASADGVVAERPDHANFNWDDEVRRYSIDNAKNVDFILIGRKIATDFIGHWGSVAADPNDSDHEFAALIASIPKVVFSKTAQNTEWPNATVAHGDIADNVNRLKGRTDGDLLVYGGSGFVSSLIENDLIDEYYLLVNPVIFGSGLAIARGLNTTRRLELFGTRAFACGTVALEYERHRTES